MSRRAGKGRREWISMGPLGWVTIGPFMLAIWLMYRMVWLTVMLGVLLVRGVRLGVRQVRR